MAGSPTPEHALDHVVVALFENRSFDNVLGQATTGSSKVWLA
jgi:phospholipase C